MSRYRYLFSPLRVGPVVLANRIVFAAHLTNYAEDGLPTEQHAAYYAARAAGGAGLIITEEHSTHPTDWPYEKLIHGFHPEVIPGYRRITDAVHRHDTPVFAQINHNGGQGSGMYSRLPVWAPSPVADPLFREVPKEVDRHEIAEIVAGYALVADHCKAGGFDGIELQCSHSSIVRGFLSPAMNVRTDRYGGSLENRARLLLEIVAAVRDVIGRNLALGVRLCGDELIEGGTTIDDAVDVARMVEQQGLTDYINTSIGVATASLFMIEASMHVPPGYALFIPSALRKAVDLPVVGVGRFKDPMQAERALAEGHGDLVGVVRGQIADPDFAAKARAGVAEDIRLCLSCNQECVGRMGLNRWLGCIENARTGRESSPPIVAAPSPRKVVVVGGGPGGLQAAATAASRGHRVVLFERDDQLGGQARLAATVPSRAEFGDIVRNLVHACRQTGVDVRTGTSVDAAAVLATGPDAVVIATGAEPARPYWAPADATTVVDVRDVLEGQAQPAGRVVVVDELGFHQATSVAELLADRGCDVTVITPGMVVGQDLGITLDLEHWNVRAAGKGIEQRTDLVPMAWQQAESPSADRPTEGTLTEGTLTVLHHPTGQNIDLICDWVVLAVPPTPVEWLYFALAGSPGVEVHRIGDCVAPRRAHAAVIEGAERRVDVVIAVVVVRDGVLPAGADEATAEAAGQVLLVGERTVDAAKELRGAVDVVCAETGAFAPAAWSIALAPHLEDHAVVVLPASPDGRDLAPRLAYALGRPLLAGAIAVDEKQVVVARSGGLIAEQHTLTGDIVVTFEPGVRGVESLDATPHISTLDVAIPDDQRDAEVVDVLPPDPATVDLAEAPRIVAGGAGLGGPEPFATLAHVAAGLEASHGASRVAADAGWAAHDRFIGTTGVAVNPALYIALGISGAVQHISGLGDPEHIIAVNTDASAPMMAMADLAIVTDARVLLDELANRLGLNP